MMAPSSPGGRRLGPTRPRPIEDSGATLSAIRSTSNWMPSSAWENPKQLLWTGPYLVRRRSKWPAHEGLTE